MTNSVELQVLTFTDNQLFGGAFLASSDSLVFHNTKVFLCIHNILEHYGILQHK